MSSILPKAKTQFLDRNGKPLAGCQVYFYIPGTTTPKNTYQDPELTILNTNPVTLNARGEAAIWGAGSFRQVVKDPFNVTVYDGLTIAPLTLNDMDTVILPAVIAKLGESSGAANIGLEQGGTVQDAIKYVTPEMFGAKTTTTPGFENFDSRPAFQAAINYAAANNIAEVRWTGKYRWSSFGGTAILPGDDGTVAPQWKSAGDADITPEPVVTMPYYIKLANGVKLVSPDNRLDDVISGTWNRDTGDISVAQPIGIYVGAASKSGLITVEIDGGNLASMLLPIYQDGIAVDSYFNFKVTACGIPGIYQGVERCSFGDMEYSGCYTGDIIGGHWLQRNNTQNPAYLPPYPASDVQLLGWADYCPTRSLIVSQHSAPFGPRHLAIDSFFDTYFFKSGNSAKTSAGGRLSNNSNNTGAIANYFGVAGRARTVFSRYGRQINVLDADYAKFYGQNRTPMFTSAGSGRNIIWNCYAENLGLVDNSGSAAAGNFFGIDYIDPYNPTRSGIGFLIAEGQFQLDAFTPSSRLQHAPLVSSPMVQSARQTDILYRLAASTGSAEIKRAVQFNGTTTDILYLWNTDSCFSQPIAFSLGGPTFSYAEGNFTPTLAVGGAAITLSVARGYYIRNGKTITGNIQMQTAAGVTLPAGDIVVSGLPFTIPAGSTAVHHGQVTDFSLGPAGLAVLPMFNDGTTTITLAKDSRGTKLNGSEASTGTLFLRISFTMSISG